MRALLLTLVVLWVLLWGVFLSADTACAQYQYYCHTPDGLTYWAHNPCAYEGYYNFDYDKGPPYNFHQNDFHGCPLTKETERDHPRAHSGRVCGNGPPGERGGGRLFCPAEICN
jgi:hypothetical protein